MPIYRLRTKNQVLPTTQLGTHVHSADGNVADDYYDDGDIVVNV